MAEETRVDWTLHEGDCLEVMRELPSESVDAVITDPPYGIASDTKVQKRGVNDLATFDLVWDRTLPLEWIEHAARIMRPGASFVAFTDSNEVGSVRDVLVRCGVRPLQNIFWHKVNPPPQPRKNFASAVEVAVFGRKEGKVLHWGGGGATKNIFAAPIVQGHERTDHPTQKPKALMSWLIRLVVPPGGTILDPFAGSGTTGVAAVENGRNVIMIEREPEYCEIIRRRMSTVTVPLPLAY